MIHLVERILAPKEFTEIDESLLRHLLESIVLQVLRKGSARPEADGDRLGAARDANLTSLTNKGPRRHGEEVGGERRRLSEAAQRTSIRINRFNCALRTVRHHRPLGGSEHLKGQARLNIRLIEEWCHAMCLVRLKVGVDVLGAIFRVNEAEEAVAPRIEEVLVLNLQQILSAWLELRPVKGEPVAVPLRVCDGGAVEAHGADRLPAEAEEDRTARSCGKGEADDNASAESV